MGSRSRLRHVLFGVYVVVCLCTQIWPVYAWLGNSIEPRILGLPFSFAWVIGWVLMTFFVLVTYHVTGERQRKRAVGSGE